MPQSLLQTPFWAEMKAKNKWQAITLADTSILIRNLPLGFSLAYAPEVSGKDWEKWLPQYTQEIKNFAASNKLIFARLEIFENLENPEIIKKLIKFDYTKSFEEVQPETRQVLDISPDEEQILAQMKPKGRYNINVARKHGVEVAISNDLSHAEVDAQEFHALFVQTGKRNQFSFRPMEYFRDLLQTLYINKAGFYLKATYQGKTLCALIISHYDHLASYLYGASSDEHREVMAPYLAHWQAILKGKELGCTTYDFLAIAPPGEDETHKYAGITRFKQQFGGHPQYLIGSWDLIFRPFWYTIYRLREKRRRGI